MNIIQFINIYIMPLSFRTNNETTNNEVYGLSEMIHSTK